MIEAYPLHWPPNWKRTKDPDWSRFGTSFASARDGLITEARLLGARDLIISTNIPLRLDGLPYANRRMPDDPGVAVYFKLDGNNQCMPCDKWDHIEDNLHAIELTVAALRGIGRWGAKDMVNAAFKGFKALPETAGVGEQTPWYDVLECSPNASTEMVKFAYKRRASKHHPDTGGSNKAFADLQNAYKRGLEASK